MSVEEARLWYQRAFDADGADEGTRLEAACHLVVLLRRRGDADSLKDAEVWYQRAIDLNLAGKGEERPAAWIAAFLKDEGS